MPYPNDDPYYQSPAEERALSRIEERKKNDLYLVKRVEDALQEFLKVVKYAFLYATTAELTEALNGILAGELQDIQAAVAFEKAGLNKPIQSWDVDAEVENERAQIADRKSEEV